MTTEIDQAAPLLLERITHEYDGYTILHLREFDIGVDAFCEDDHHATYPQPCNGVRVFVYRARWSDEGQETFAVFSLHGGGEPLTEAPERIGSPLLASVTSAEDHLDVVLTNGTAIAVGDKHVHGFDSAFDGHGDGDSCSAIVHTAPVDRHADCDPIGDCYSRASMTAFDIYEPDESIIRWGDDLPPNIPGDRW